ncbi:MAG: hypothetical protein ACKVS8_12365 [Phycisphaerales bacterium]
MSTLLDPFVLLAAGGAGTVVLGLVLALRAWRALPAAEQAFLAMSLRLGLGRRQRAALRRMAADSGVAPVALLLSPTAFNHACASVAAAGGPAGEVIARLRHRLGWNPAA